MCIAGGRIDGREWQASRTTGATSRAQVAPRQIGGHVHLFYEGDAKASIYIVEDGWVKLYRTLIDGQRQIVGFANAGSILGLESDSDHSNSCETITTATVRAIPVSALGDLCRADPRLAEELLRQVGRQLGAAQAQLASVGAQSAEQKLATFLLSIADLCEAGENGEFDLPMRRGDMAEFLGVRLETVSRKMTDFQRRGLICMTSLYHCRIVRRSTLEELADGGEAGSFLAVANG